MAKSGAEPRKHRPKRPDKREQAGPQASLNKAPWHTSIRQYIKHHIRSVRSSLMRHLRSPLSTLLTCSVIGIALFFPAILYVALQNLKQAGKQWPQTVQVSVFLKKNVSHANANKIAGKIGKNRLVKSTRVLSPTMVLAEYTKLFNIQQPFILKHNPLPSVIVIDIHNQRSEPLEVRLFADSLKKYGRIESIHLDETRIKRLYKLVEIGNRIILVLAILLALGVILVIGNTIRLDIQNRKDEIIVSKLIGASNSYIRLPFLYSGFWYGVLGGLVALFVTIGIIFYFSQPIAELAQLSGDSFLLQSLSIVEIATLLGGSALLGLLGSWLSVSQHLHAIEPT